MRRRLLLRRMLLLLSHWHRWCPSLTYTTWGKWNPNATTTASDTDNRYGNAAWSALWEHANPPNFTETGIFNTTVSPTPVPTSELVLPPRDYFGPTDCYYFPEGFMFGVSSSSSQIEGAVAEEGKGPSLMEILVETPFNVPSQIALTFVTGSR